MPGGPALLTPHDRHLGFHPQDKMGVHNPPGGVCDGIPRHEIPGFEEV